MNKHEANNVRALWGQYRDRDIFVVGTGTSLAHLDWTRLNPFVTIALNDAVKVPGYIPTFHLFCDVGIWKRYDKFDLDPSTIMVCQRRARDQFLRSDHCKFKDRVYHFNHVSVAKSMIEENDDLFISRTVATGGICMAWKLGARRIFLMGIDGYKLQGPNGGVYYHDGSGKGKEHRKESTFDDGRVTQDRHKCWRDNMEELRKYFNKRKLYMGPWRGPGIYMLSWLSTIDTWQKIKVKNSPLGKGCFFDEVKRCQNTVSRV